MAARRRTIATTAVIALVTTLGVTACTDSPPGPQDAATALAAGLQSGALDGVAFAAGTTAPRRSSSAPTRSTTCSRRSVTTPCV